MSRPSILVLVALALVHGAAQAQTRDSILVLSREARLYSKVLKEDRRVLVRVPPGYTRSGQDLSPTCVHRELRRSFPPPSGYPWGVKPGFAG